MKHRLLYTIGLVALAVFLCRGGPRAAEGTGARVWVLAVGVNQYTRPAYHALPYASSAARQVAGLLRDARPEETTACVMTCDAPDATLIPNKSNLLDKLADIQPGAKDVVVFYYCGHGVEIPGADGRPAEQYLLLRDVGDLTDPEAREAGAVKLSWLRAKLEALPCDSRLLILDACRETPESLVKSAGDSASQPQTEGFHATGGGWTTARSATLLACSPGERAYCSKRGQSYFAEALAEGLGGKAADDQGEITLASLARYVVARVPESIRADQLPDLRQTPAVVPEIPAPIPLRPAPGVIACPSFGGEYGKPFADTVYTRLAASREVNLVDRKRLTTEELKFQNSGLTDAQTAQEIGKLVNARYVLVGGSEKVPGDRLQVSAYLLEVATGRQVPGVAADCTVNPADFDTWKPALQALAENLLKQMRAARLTVTRPGPQLAMSALAFVPATPGPAPAAATGSLRVESEPPGAQVFVGGDDQPRGVTPLALDGIPAGEIAVVVRSPREEFGDVTRAVTITPGQPALLKADLPLLQGALLIRTAPPGATVSVDGQPRGVTTAEGLRVIGLRIGEHAVALSLDRHQPWEGQVAVRFGAVTEVAPALSPLPGVLVVSSTPPGARVFLNAETEPRGTATTTLRDVPAGKHTVRLALEGYREAVQEVDLPPAGQKVVALTLEVAPTRPPQLTPAPSIPSLPGTGAVQTWTNPKDGMEFVFVPAGEFTMGSDDGQDDEKPAHKVSLPGYWIGKCEVTVAQYRRFCQETGRQMPDGQGGDNHPVVNVTWEDAAAYAQWAGCRLPTEAEWEKAARGTDAREFVWGAAWPPPRGAGNFADVTAKTKHTDWTILEGYDDGFADAAPVGSFPAGASPYGCLDMAGNVWEWCGSVYKPYPYRADDGREDPNDNSMRVFRGASFGNVGRGNLRAAIRNRFDRGLSLDYVGFRCARSSQE
ncbi:MAG: SUMF1/EgtB/PvdO family nonheme iron enzyme [Armatimonadetes bacterium]|nr:SUMF1/EgtB/PvdO family nonheme iron enzyme [Armatimonadota bacterium]